MLTGFFHSSSRKICEHLILCDFVMYMIFFFLCCWVSLQKIVACSILRYLPKMETVVSTLMLIKGFHRRVNRIGLKNGCVTTCALISNWIGLSLRFTCIWGEKTVKGYFLYYANIYAQHFSLLSFEILNEMFWDVFDRTVHISMDSHRNAWRHSQGHCPQCGQEKALTCQMTLQLVLCHDESISLVPCHFCATKNTTWNLVVMNVWDSNK